MIKKKSITAILKVGNSIGNLTPGMYDIAINKTWFDKGSVRIEATVVNSLIPKKEGEHDLDKSGD